MDDYDAVDYIFYDIIKIAAKHKWNFGNSWKNIKYCCVTISFGLFNDTSYPIKLNYMIILGGNSNT